MEQSFKGILKKLSIPIIISNLLFTGGAIISSIVIPTYLYEHLLYMKPESWDRNIAVSFDGLSFLQNDYQWEQNYAFLPGYTYFLKSIQYVMSLFFENSTVPLLIMSIIINKIITIVNVIILYKFANQFLSKKASKLVAILFLFNPAAIFYHSVYSEPLFMFLTLLGMINALQHKQDPTNTITYIKTNITGLLIFSLSTIIRTTGMFYSLLYGVPIIVKLLDSLRSQKFKNCIKIAMTGACTLFFFVLPFVIYLISAYFNFCNQQIHSQFCDKAIPNIYSEIQDRFWNVGFLKYYSSGQQMQCIFGLITVFVLVVSFQKSMYKTLPLKGLLLSLIIITYLTVFHANVQSGTRFISTHPIFYLNLAYFLMKNGGKLNPFKILIIFYFCAFTMFGLIFFPARFSWA